eukprot:scaffold48060_cov64-Phaeocystis_antarctica.AAC.1
MALTVKARAASRRSQPFAPPSRAESASACEPACHETACRGHSVSRRWLPGESSQAWALSVRADATYVIEALRRLCRGRAVVQVRRSRGAFSQPVVARAAARLDPQPISGARAWQRQAPRRRWQVCSSPKPGEEDWRALPSAEAAAHDVGTFREGKRNEIFCLAVMRRELFLRSSALFPAVGTVTHLTSTLGGSSSANYQA